jgi:hypothetical protein
MNTRLAPVSVNEPRHEVGLDCPYSDSNDVLQMELYRVLHSFRGAVASQRAKYDLQCEPILSSVTNTFFALIHAYYI